MSLAIVLLAALLTGPERGVTTPQLDTAAFDQSNAALATDGHSFFAVWTEWNGGQTAGVFGSFVSYEGTRVGEPIRLADAPTSDPVIAFGAGRYLAVWNEEAGLRGRFIAPDGTLSNVMAIAPRAYGLEIQVAFNGSVFLAAWWLDTSMHGAIIDADGNAHAPFTIPIADLRFIGDLVAARGRFYLLIENGGIAALPVMSDGSVRTPVPIAPVSAPIIDLHAGSNGDELLVAWIEGAEIRSAFLSPMAGASAIESFEADRMRLQKVTNDFVLFYGTPEVQLARRGGRVMQLATPQTRGAVTDAESSIVLYRGDPYVAGGDLYVGTLDAQQFTPLVLSPRHQTHPDIAAAGDLRLAAWSEYIGSEHRLGIVAARIDADGRTLDPSGIDLHAATQYPTYPRIASNGTDFLVTWADGHNIYASRVSHDGAVLDAQPFRVAGGIYLATMLDAAWDGRSYVVVYEKGGYFRGVYVVPTAVRVTSEGEVLAPELALDDVGPHPSINIASSGDGSLITWDGADFFGAASKGVLLSRTDVMTRVDLHTLSLPSAAWNGREFLVAGIANHQLRWRMIDANGNVRDPLSTYIDEPDAQSVAVEPIDGGFLLAWRDHAAFVNDEGYLTDPPIETGLDSVAAAGNTIVYAREIGDRIPAITRVFTREIARTPHQPKRRNVRR